MSKKRSSRFQVPIREEYAKDIAILADDLQRSSSWLALGILEKAVEDRNSIVNWFSGWMVGKLYRGVSFVTGKKRRSLKGQKEVRLQLNPSSELVDKVTVLAEKMNQSPVKMAGILIEAGLDSQEIVLDVLKTQPMQALIDRVKAIKQAPERVKKSTQG